MSIAVIHLLVFANISNKNFRQYLFNLRGGVRGRSGESARQEGQNVFEILTGVAITILVKKKGKDNKLGTINYYDIGDYLSRKDKLNLIENLNNVYSSDLKWQTLNPNIHNDWLNPKDENFGSFIALGNKDNKKANTFFVPYYSRGVATSRDVIIPLKKNL